ncbi:MAG: response regulator receiver [Firmicutes bacterium]|nr:response regulator receiver [Bacillota bacterium]
MMHILVVDDDDGSLRGMQIALEMLGHTCDTYTDPIEAMRDCIGLGYIDKYDALVTDIQMPTLNGIRLAGLLQYLVPELKIVVISGSATEDTKQELAQYGFYTLLHKPVSAQQLSAALQKEFSGISAASRKNIVN